MGIGRYRRGERLSAHKFIKHDALHNLLALISQRVPSAQETFGDDLDAARRFEFRYPGLGGRLEGLMETPIPSAAVGLLEIFSEIWVSESNSIPDEAIEIVRRALSNSG